jgi:hypothetical protein
MTAVIAAEFLTPGACLGNRSNGMGFYVRRRSGWFLDQVGRLVVSEKTYRAWRPDQVWLLPPSPRDWLAEGHLVYLLMDAVRELDISAITSHYET